METLSQLQPTENIRVMDIVEQSGIDISDWENFKGGKEKAASNPRYCYEWSFVENDTILLNLWFEDMLEVNDAIQIKLNMRSVAEKYEKNKKTWSKRASKMDFALQKAARLNLPVRVMVLEGTHQNLAEDADRPSQVSKRLLDPSPWSVTKYDSSTGECLLIRGLKESESKYIDQFHVLEEPLDTPERRRVSTLVHNRSPAVREQALNRAKGKCEWCGLKGFVMNNDKTYLETHHIIPLAENGPDILSNVIALCPNHHRKAHYGAKADEMRLEMINRIKILG